MSGFDIANKVKALLALASNPNTNEALAAMKKVKELCERYSLDLQKIQREDKEGLTPLDDVVEIVQESYYPRDKKRSNYKVSLAGSVSRYFGLKGFLDESYEGKTYSVIGNKAKVVAALALYGMLESMVKRLVASYPKGKGKKFYHSIRMGFAIEIREKVENELEATQEAHVKRLEGGIPLDEKTLAIQCIKDSEQLATEAYLEEKGLSFQKAKTGGYVSDSEGARQGRNAAKGVNLGTRQMGTGKYIKAGS